MGLEQIHPVLITRDAGATIERTLLSLRQFPEVIVYDNGSVDDTLAACARFPNVVVHSGEFMGFGPTKAHAARLASGDWVLSIDADEYLSDALLQSLAAVDLADEDVAYALERHNLFMGRDMRRGGWGDDWLVRLFNRRRCQFNDSIVHERVDVPVGVRLERLHGTLWHQAVTDLDQFLTKISRYSELEIERGSRTHRPIVTVIHAAWRFIRSYILDAGFLEGWRGLVIAVAEANGSFFKHMKRYVNRNVPAAERRRTLE